MILLKSSAASSRCMAFCLACIRICFFHEAKQIEVSHPPSLPAEIYIYIKFHIGVTLNCIIFTRSCNLPVNAKRRVAAVMGKYVHHILLSSRSIFLMHRSKMTTSFMAADNKSSRIFICLSVWGPLHLKAGVHILLWQSVFTKSLLEHAELQREEDFIDRRAHKSGRPYRHLLSFQPSPSAEPRR